MAYRSYIALGSNIEPRETYLKEAIEALSQDQDVELIALSKVYQTAPVGFLDQGAFLNMVVAVDTTYEPLELLALTQSIEESVGREKTFRNGPRQIDLDILLFAQTTLETERLTIPHPRMTERAFVLVPLSDLAKHEKINDKTVQSYVNELDSEELAGVEYYAEHI
ncbi:2-amino-4-hydroxy-6-hydroxymethyldihydropteridine diphosphokinase [Alkalibacillus almallahensis]|uniref:2-amino-4-hydroxy-6- hydroxymethyldihydropteridine diphosphokinase n=1 Tax=Alkalibacillus almallahensis TaxID=1379154 RepID=UPI001421C339|nr:2-amino-4-hydroxy-6-hydroxymethyldihydropteridine diphosphokinase [Alkalibacillus almallahensis]NIK12684.1 2-amino-4-hydroxy-6-hydroxymethyldihydropteridine diphosphokinase [Alkalibacillus almallahensis]